MNRNRMALQFPISDLEKILSPAAQHAGLGGGHAPDVREIFREPQPVKQKTPGEQLFDVAPSPERDALLSNWAVFTQDLDHFFATERQKQLDRDLAEAADGLIGTSGHDKLKELLQKMLDLLKEKDAGAAAIPTAFGLLTIDLTPRLAQSSGGPERDRLLERLGQLLSQIQDFLSRQGSQRRQTLELRRAKLWASCRQLEDRLKAGRAEIAGFEAKGNSLNVELATWRQKLSDVRPPDTSFPTAQEVADFQAQRSAVVREIAIRENALKENRGFLQTARHEGQQALEDLRAGVEELQGIDRELKG